MRLVNQALLKYRVLITDPVDSVLISGLEEKGLSVTYIPDAEPGHLRNIIGEFDAVVVRSRTRLDSEVLENSGKLKLVARAGIGLDTIDTDFLRERKIEVRYAPGESTESVAELAIGLMIIGSRNILNLSNELKKGSFKKQKGFELSGKTLGIIGFGRIGFRVAEIASRMGMKIIAHDIVQNLDLISKVEGKYRDLRDLLGEADVIALFVTTRRGEKPVLGEEELGIIKKGSMLINTSRASAVEGHALLSSLEDGSIAFYGADVLWNEPPSERWELDLLSLQNVVVTPHIGAQTVESQKRIAERTVSEITEFMERLK